jgi:hypothetical protein
MLAPMGGTTPDFEFGRRSLELGLRRLGSSEGMRLFQGGLMRITVLEEVDIFPIGPNEMTVVAR